MPLRQGEEEDPEPSPTACSLHPLPFLRGYKDGLEPPWQILSTRRIDQRGFASRSPSVCPTQVSQPWRQWGCVIPSASGSPAILFFAPYVLVEELNSCWPW